MDARATLTQCLEDIAAQLADVAKVRHAVQALPVLLTSGEALTAVRAFQNRLEDRLSQLEAMGEIGRVLLTAGYPHIPELLLAPEAVQELTDAEQTLGRAVDLARATGADGGHFEFGPATRQLHS